MSHDIVDNSRLWTALGTQGLVVASWVENEFANEGSVLTEHADVLVGDQEVDAEPATCLVACELQAVSAHSERGSSDALREVRFVQHRLPGRGTRAFRPAVGSRVRLQC